MTHPAAALVLAGCAAHVPPPAPPPPREPAAPDDVGYYVVVDRFADGDRWNNESFDRADRGAWHGGDLRGVIDRLDYLQELGVGRVWLSPIAMSPEDGRPGTYRGRWPERPDLLEPRAGTIEQARELAAATERRRMEVVLDLVLNQVAPESPLLVEHPGWFHPPAPATDSSPPAAQERGWFEGLPDLDQANPEVYAWARDLTLRWIADFGADAVCVDGMRRLPDEFVRRLVADVRSTHPRVAFVGRYPSAQPEELAQVLRRTGVSAVFDYPLHEALVDVFCGGAPVSRLATVLSGDRAYDDPRAQLVTFLDDGDLPRVAAECASNGRGADDVHQALAVLLAARGSPLVTYGAEFGLAGRGRGLADGDVPWTEKAPYAVTIRELAAGRRANPALREGVDWVFHLDGADVLGLARVAADQAAVVLVNRGAEQAMVRLPAELATGVSMSTFHEVVDAEGPFLRHQLVANATPGARLRPFFLVGHSTVVAYLEPAAAGAFAPLVERIRAWNREVVPVVFEVDDGSVAWAAEGGRTEARLEVLAGDRAVVVGGADPLGRWDPALGLPLGPGPGGTWATAPVELPAWTAVEWRLGVVRADGRVVVEDGPPRASLIRQEPALTLKVSTHRRPPVAVEPGPG